MANKDVYFWVVAKSNPHDPGVDWGNFIDVRFEFFVDEKFDSAVLRDFSSLFWCWFVALFYSFSTFALLLLSIYELK